MSRAIYTRRIVRESSRFYRVTQEKNESNTLDRTRRHKKRKTGLQNIINIVTSQKATASLKLIRFYYSNAAK